MKKDILVILLKVFAYAIGLLLAYFGVSSLSSCSVSHKFESFGHSRIISVDTTNIYHNGYISFPKK